MRRFHRWFGVGSAIIVLLAVVTGLLWAYAPYLYWEGSYMEIKQPHMPDDYETLKLTPPDAIRLARPRLGEDAVVSSVTLRSEAGHAFYAVTSGPQTVLIDARAQSVVSPLSPELAQEFARQYLAGSPAPSSVKRLESFRHRKGETYPDVYRIDFETERNPAIFLSASSGRILEEEDDVRRFHFWVMRLHQLNFFGFKKTLTIIPGSALLLLLGSGLWLSRRSRRRLLANQNQRL